MQKTETNTQLAGYEQLFSQRGHVYDAAMRAVPGARTQEFEEAVTRACLQTGMRVADVPAGGGYLAAHLPEGCAWLGHEPCANFVETHSSFAKPLLPLPWADASVDAAISIAGVHHLQDKRSLYRDLWRVVRPGGRLVLADAWLGSPVATFLDGFVGAHNSTGHQGVYLDESTSAELSKASWQVLAVERPPLLWRFSSEAELADFCSVLFDLREVTREQVLAAVHADLAVASLADGVGLHWQLTYFTALRGPDPLGGT